MPPRVSRSTTVLYVLFGLGMTTLTITATVLHTSNVMDHPLRWLALVALLAVGPVLAFGKWPRMVRALGRGLLLWALTGYVVTAFLSLG